MKLSSSVLLLFPIGSLVAAQDWQMEKLTSCKPQDYDGCHFEIFTTTVPEGNLKGSWYFAHPCLSSGQSTDPGICNKAGDKEADCVASKCTWISRQDKITPLGNVADVVNDIARLGQEITPHQQGSCVPQPACDIFNSDERRCATLSHCQWQPGVGCGSAS